MVNYECKLCCYETKIKYQLNRHNNTNKHKNNVGELNKKDLETLTFCEKELKKNFLKNKKELERNRKRTEKELLGTQKELSEIYCDFCGQTFKTRHIMLKHVRLNCKVKKEIIKEDEIKELKSQMEELKLQVKNSTNTTNNTTTQSHNNSSINNSNNKIQQNTINLNIFGKEDLSMITDDIKKDLIQGPFKMMPKLLELIYFNDKYPENHTLKMVNKNKEIIKVHEKKGWKLKDKKDTVDYLLEDKNFTVDSYYDDNEQEFSQRAKKTYNNFRELFDSRDRKLWNQIKREVDLLLWNNM
jgi:hypothetical protein